MSSEIWLSLGLRISPDIAKNCFRLQPWHNVAAGPRPECPSSSFSLAASTALLAGGGCIQGGQSLLLPLLLPPKKRDLRVQAGPHCVGYPQTGLSQLFWNGWHRYSCAFE